jgi:RNA polymerase sigma-70 factor (ECF subfamily)
MTAQAPADVTRLLAAWRDGDDEALGRLLPLIEHELRRRAQQHMRREGPRHTLQTTALVNEAYLRLVRQREVSWQNRAHFFAIASQAMRRILVDHAKSRRRAKRGGGARAVTLEEAAVLAPQRSEEVLALDAALAKLEAFDARKARLVEMRYFAGLSVEETAQVLAVSTATVMRDWRVAKAWLRRELEAPEAP